MKHRARAALVGVTLVIACSGELGNQTDPEPRSGPPCPTTLDELSSQVFEVSCATLGCHNSSDRAAGLDLQASPLELELYGQEAALCSGEVRIVPGDAESSYLIDKLRGTGCGSQMPVVEPLADETIDCIAAWIDGLEPLVSSECETTCPPTASCIDGICTCPDAESICTGACVNLLSDPTNCGRCGNDCGDLVCLEGQCVSDCGDLSECNGACVDLMSDSASCGTCNNPCGTGASCVGGQCECRDATVSLANDIQPIFTASCASSGCHDGIGAPAGGGGAGGATTLNLTAGNALQSLLDTTTPCGPVLVPGDVVSSVLIGKLDGTELCQGSQMPKGNDMLTTEEIDLIATWVCQGAADN